MVKYSWSSSNESILSNSGIFTKPYISTQVTLTCSLSYQGLKETISFTLPTSQFKDLTDGVISGYTYFSTTSITDYTYENLDILYCAFAEVSKEGTISNISTFGRYVTNNILTKAHNNGVYVMLSLNNEDNVNNLSVVAKDDALRKNLASCVVNAINTYNLDGVDLDWEFPSTSEATYFTLLIKEIYTQVKTNNINHLVTAAVGIDVYKRYDLVNSINYLDYINVMTYDMQNSSKSTHHSPLYYSNGKVYKTITNAYTYYKEELNVPSNKIILGIPFYGIKYTNTQGLGTTGTKSGAITFTSIKSTYIDSNSPYCFFDDICKVPYIYDNVNNIFITYDNPLSISYKCAYVKEKTLGGLMFWEYRQDSNNELLKAMVDGLK